MLIYRGIKFVIMKKIFFVSVIIAMATFLVSFTVTKQVKEHKKVSERISITLTDSFPTYDITMDLGMDCSANCTFSSCTGTGECSCECHWFKCSCTAYDDPQEKGVQKCTVSMNEVQYKKTRLLASVLKSLDEKRALNAYKSLSMMVENLKEKDMDKFYKNRDVFIENIHNLSNSSKDQTNSFFEILGAEERV